MGKHGINPKQWFYGFRADLRRRQDHVRQVLAGAAAEQWLNAEFCAYLARTVPRDLYAYPEYRKRDISVFSFDANTTEDHDLTEAVIETKLVYGGYSRGKVSAYAARLAQQMRAASRSVRDEQDAPCLVLGLALGVWVSWPRRPGRRGAAEGPSLKTLRIEGGRALREGAKRHGARPARESLETLLEPGSVKNGGQRIEVALVGQYLLLQ